MAYLRAYGLDTSFDIELPFEVKFNFEKMLDYWRNLANSNNKDDAHRANNLLQMIEKDAPALLQPFDDFSIIEKHEKELKALFEPLFPALTSDNDIKAISIPFAPVLFNPTQRLTDILDGAGEDYISMMRQEKVDLSYMNACMFILNFKYGVNIKDKSSVFFDIPDNKSGILRHYRVFINGNFSSFVPKEDFRPLSQEEIKELINNVNNIDLWKEKIPPKSFTYEGFAIIKLFDVTEDEAVSALKMDLLKKDALATPHTVEDIRHHLSSLLGIDGLKLGFASFNKEKDILKSLGYGYWNDLALDGEEETNATSFCHYSKHALFEKFDPLTFPEYTEEHMANNSFLKGLKLNNINSYIAVPLVYDNEIIGVFELGSEKKNELNALTVNRLEQVIPLFTTALKRSLDEHETQMEAIVQDQFTAIHSSVSWRFFEAAQNLVQRRQSDPKAIVEEITFPSVYPLFGQSDIKGSSTERNKAIQGDMIEQLELARNVIKLAISKYQLPIYDQLKYKIEGCIRGMRKGLNAGDEIEVLGFLQQDIYPSFRYLATLEEDMKKVVDEYNHALNPELGVLYKRRKDYEQSVQLINNSIGEYLSKAQVVAQQMFPHYFEQYKTDGVEHNLYIGQSIVNSKSFNELHLQNLRLWQLMTICETENLMELEIKPQLKVPLSIASLILAHHNPITIKFRQEEKRFDVEGAYNIRYEIIKKRIDKALIKGTTERLTQPGKIAIVYSQDREAREYRQYIEYLQSIRYLSKNVEWVDLNDLQGVTGLKAIRVEVIYRQSVPENNKIKNGKKVRQPILVKT